ncbi:MAG: DUF2207 domain-containing protein [Acidobacteria bacterium]|nr:DUF2207 domain-containing protein [Acidobacteriota bacterium]MDW7985248.1 DUF2207 domain-containing protein [Acidobacteriota bacterium]
MRSWLIGLVGVLVGWGIDLKAFGQTSFPHIWDYQVTLDVQPDGRLLITETIGVDFGPVRRHGIYRTLPVRYERPGVGGLSVTYHLRVQLISVTGPVGQPYRVRQRQVGRSIEWRIGDPDVYVQGRQTYVIRYEVQRGLLFLSDHDELYWNCIGHEWEWSIQRARCAVLLPEDVDPASVRTAFYTGHPGSREQKGRSWTEGRQTIFETGPLAVGEGLTVVVGWPKGVVRPPATWQNLVWWASDNWGVLLGGLFPLVAGGFLFLRWRRYGQDPRGRPAIVAQYQPPAGLTPAEVGVLLDERADPVDITATVLHLAVRGYLRIREAESPKMLVFKNKDYILEFPPHAPSVDTLKDHERIVYAGLRTYDEENRQAPDLVRLFRKGSTRASVRLSDLKGHFYRTLQAAQAALYKKMTADGYFAGNPQKIRDTYRGVGFLLFPLGGVLGAGAVSALGLSPLNGVAIGVGLGLVGLLLILFGPAMPRRTAKGVQALEGILGFREFIRRVETDRLERLLRDEPNLFDRVLPYALVFGIADEWAEKFQGLLRTPPDWYESPTWTLGTFQPGAFMHSLSHSVASMNSVLPATPSRSPGFESGESGLDGGGSSGGGGGGGGGGGW